MDDASPGSAGPDTGATSGATDDRGAQPDAGRWRRWLAWAGIITLAVLVVLATWHLWTDVHAVLSIRGGTRAVLGRLAPAAILALVAGATALLVVWLAGAGRRREALAVAIGMGLLLIIRIFVAATFDGQQRGEPSAYDAIAESFLTPQWDFRGRPMGYPAVLAAAYVLFSDRQLAVEALNLLLAALAGGMVLAIGRGLYGPRAGAIALLGYALWPAGALMTSVRMPEIAYDLAIAASAWASVATPPGWRGSGVAGALLGLSQYLRPSTPALLPAFLIARMWPGGRWRDLLVGAAVPLLVMFVVVLMPVIMYNAGRTGELSISTSDYGGHTFYMGTNIASGGRFDEAANNYLIELAGPDIIARSELGTQLAWQRIREDPVGIAELAIRKQNTLWGTETFGVAYGIDRWLLTRPANPRAATAFLLSQGFYLLVLVAALGGLFLKRRRPDALMVLAILMIWSVSAVHSVLEVRDRHHSYVIPLLLPIAALGLTSLWVPLERWIGRARMR